MHHVYKVSRFWYNWISSGVGMGLFPLKYIIEWIEQDLQSQETGPEDLVILMGRQKTILSNILGIDSDIAAHKPALTESHKKRWLDWTLEHANRTDDKLKGVVFGVYRRQRKPRSIREQFGSEHPSLVSKSFTGTEQALERCMSDERTVINKLSDLKVVMQQGWKVICVELGSNMAGSMHHPCQTL
ncbi:hypothetical protein PHYBLDRAFT_140181 [Phycomyces blakesleeanus NRRL 1555(-)]|uniref:Uncharacterized protein n=1 Tax=Phycomyces blakesleeanus (strain ATCC 8743b / DSM 1359 / FGSC 10004 / NBRC 33097 / NRRL 1555) TaxID=763407 RepID=A0A162V5Q1_PHYB8|nr:hypothetical protein PHYBLDRAFT_140181 [Phycomyces blakesleeanus NRRL 1555(-)]OAD80173.1 hypothetical protein PHYBLDRAFT_140181 [Phycomyces blakesleeanus NRRL 1555(-)]|eukprot:XP_018298213.1 hypothetical protein PHYBLDRAFT_140181 [Phycomyces blakesleeanus NRRL 1555(-)]